MAAAGDTPLILLLTLVFTAIGTAIAAGGTAFSTLVADRTSDDERPQVLSLVWGMRLFGVLLAVFWSTRCSAVPARLVPAPLRCWRGWSG